VIGQRSIGTSTALFAAFFGTAFFFAFGGADFFLAMGGIIPKAGGIPKRKNPPDGPRYDPGVEEKPGFAESLARFLFGSLGGLLFQLPAAFVVDFSSAMATWVLAVLTGTLLTGFLCLSPPSRVWGAPVASLGSAGLVIALLFWRGPWDTKEAPMLGALFGGWALLAAAFAWGVLRRRKQGEGDAFWAARRQKKIPPTA
jgi:hypothetical protein